MEHVRCLVVFLVRELGSLTSTMHSNAIACNEGTHASFWARGLRAILRGVGFVGAPLLVVK